MSKSPSALRVWIGGALAAFIDGFIDGCPIGGPTGAGIALADGKLADAVTRRDTTSIAIVVAHAIAVPFFSGVADIKAWKKDNPFPNIFVPDPTAITAPGAAAITTEPTKS
jgi:hypothetical protein